MSPDALPLHTPSLLVRRFVPADAPAVFALSREAAARRWLPSQVCRDEAHAVSLLDFLIGCYESAPDPRHGPWVFALEHRADRELVGHVGLSPFEGDVEIGFGVGERWQGRGLATEAVAAVSRWALTAFALPRILGITAAANIASQRTLARAGFTAAGERRIVFQGEEQDVRVFELPAPDPGLGCGKREGAMDVIYVALMNDGVPVWRPVSAERVSNLVFRILGPVPEDEEREYQPGQVVVCEQRILSGASAVVAIRPLPTDSSPEA
jgi:RimJ/RimL family protein N-acetyltransferase